MKKLLICFVCLCFLTACSPRPLPTELPTETPKVEPTKTSIPKKSQPRPTARILPTATPNYVLETGWCIMAVEYQEGTNPSKESGCGPDEREQIHLLDVESVELTFHEFTDRQVYCVLYDLKGNFIMADVDTLGAGKVECHP